MGVSDSLRILLVDDEPGVAAALKLLLEKELSAAVVIAGDCASAREAFSTDSFDLVTLDYQLPDGDGLELLEEFTASEVHPPIIMVTGHGDEKTAARSITHGAAGYVVKDKRMSTLLPGTIRNVLESEEYRKALRGSETRYRLMFDNMSSGVAVYRAIGGGEDFAFVDFNMAGEQIEGVSREDVIGHPVSEVFPGVKEFGLFEVFQRVWRTGEPEHLPVTLYEDNRISGWRENYVYRLETGELVAIYDDVTERMRAEEGLRNAEERDRILLSNIHDVVWTLDLDLRFTYLSPSSVNLSGFTPEELTGTSVEDLLTPESLDSARALLTEQLINAADTDVDPPVPVVLEVEQKHKNGSMTQVEISAGFLRDEEGTPIGILGVSRDITERKQAEDRRRFALHLLSLLNMQTAMVDTVGEILHAVKEFTGFEAVGIRLQEGEDFPYYETNGFPASFVELERHLCAHDENGDVLRDPAGDPVLECMCGNIIRGRFDPSHPFFTENGSFWSNCTTELLASTTEEDRQSRTRNRCNGQGYESVALIPLSSGNETIGLLQLNDSRRDVFTPAMIEFFEGIAESIGVAFARKRAREALQRANAELEGYAHTVSHDLKAPITATSLAIELMQATLEKVELPEREREQLDEIIEAGFHNMSRAEAIIDDLLFLAKTGEPQDVSAVDVDEVVDDVLSDNADRIREMGITVDVGTPLGSVVASPTQIHQLFTNLVQNSIVHSGGENPLIEIHRLESKGRAHRFLVRDNGRGIPEDILDEVFLPFVKGESGGTGIGLSLVERIVSTYGGETRAYNDGGACFEFTLRDYAE